MTSQGRGGGGCWCGMQQWRTGRKHLSLPKRGRERREEAGVEPGVRQVWAKPALVTQAPSPRSPHPYTHTQTGMLPFPKEHSWFSPQFTETSSFVPFHDQIMISEQRGDALILDIEIHEFIHFPVCPVPS